MDTHPLHQRDLRRHRRAVGLGRRGRRDTVHRVRLPEESPPRSRQVVDV